MMSKLSTSNDVHGAGKFVGPFCLTCEADGTLQLALPLIPALSAACPSGLFGLPADGAHTVNQKLFSTPQPLRMQQTLFNARDRRCLVVWQQRRDRLATSYCSKVALVYGTGAHFDRPRLYQAKILVKSIAKREARVS